jgi:hypothetical protein
MEDGISSLGDVFKIEQCIRIGSPETRKLVLISKEQYESLSPLQQKRHRRIINGLDLERYRINWRHIYLKYEPETDHERLYLSKKPSIFERKKLFFRNTSKFLTVAYDGGNDSKSDHEKFFYALNTVYLLFLKDKYNNDHVDFLTKYALAYLNSPLAEFYYRAMFWGLVVPGGSIKYRECIKHVPFKVPTTKIERALVEKIVKKADVLLEINKIERRIETFPEEYIKAFKDNEKFESISVRTKYDKKYTTPIIQLDSSGGCTTDIGKKLLLSDLTCSTEKRNYINHHLTSKNIKKEDKIIILLPQSDILLRKILEDFKKDRKQLKEFPDKVKLMETINRLLYELYVLDGNDISILESFLLTFCSKKKEYS